MAESSSPETVSSKDLRILRRYASTQHRRFSVIILSVLAVLWLIFGSLNLRIAQHYAASEGLRLSEAVRHKQDEVLRIYPIDWFYSPAA